MSLISPANFCNLADKLGRICLQQVAACTGWLGPSNQAYEALDALLKVEDYTQETDMMAAFYQASVSLTLDAVIRAALPSAYSGLQRHISGAEDKPDESITDIASYCDYYNFTADPKWQAIVPEHFGRICTIISGAQFPVRHCFVHVSAAHQSSPGMGRFGKSAPFTDGVAYTTGCTNAVSCVQEEITSGGAAVWLRITGKNQHGETAYWLAKHVAAEGEWAVGSEVPLEPEDGYSKIIDVATIELETGYDWTAGTIFVKPVQVRTY